MCQGKLFIRTCFLFYVQVLIQQHKVVAVTVAEAVGVVEAGAVGVGVAKAET